MFFLCTCKQNRVPIASGERAPVLLETLAVGRAGAFGSTVRSKKGPMRWCASKTCGSRRGQIYSVTETPVIQYSHFDNPKAVYMYVLHRPKKFPSLLHLSCISIICVPTDIRHMYTSVLVKLKYGDGTWWQHGLPPSSSIPLCSRNVMEEHDLHPRWQPTTCTHPLPSWS